MDHIVVSNKSVAKVYVRSSPRNQTDGEVVQNPAQASARGSGGQYKYYFNIGSVESFEEKLEEAQEALGFDPHDYVPVTYVSEMVWYQELMRFAPTLLLLGSLLYMGRRMQGGIGVGGGGGKGARGIFNIGKAHVTKVDKNAKNKVSCFRFLLYIKWNMFAAFVILQLVALFPAPLPCLLSLPFEEIRGNKFIQREIFYFIFLCFYSGLFQRCCWL